MGKRKRPRDRKPSLRLEWVRAGDLKHHPRNWRRHGEGQKAAMRSILGRVGWANALLFNEKTGRLVDGHMRSELADPEQLVPVLVGSWTEPQELTILASRDPIAAMAQIDGKALQGLLSRIEENDPAIQALLETVEGPAMREIARTGDVAARKRKAADEEPEGPAEPSVQGPSEPKVGAAFTVMIRCRDAKDQESVLSRCQAEGVKAKAVTV